MSEISGTARPEKRASGLASRPAARRQRAYRARARSGKIVLRVEVDHARLIAATLKHGALTEAETLWRAEVIALYE